MKSLRTKIQTDLFVLLSITLILCTIGLVFVYSASSIYASEKFRSAHYFFKKHMVGIALGCIAMIITRLTPLSFVKKMSPYIFFATLGLTALTLVPAFSITIHGSSRWLNLPIIAIQPSELLKIAFILYVSALLAKKNLSINSFTHTYVPILMIIGITCALLLKQPDFGMTVCILLTAFVIMFMAQVPLRYLLSTAALMLPVIAGLIYFQPYRLKRILTFLDPWQDPQGAGFQIIQSLIAIGSGGLWGMGIGNSKQKFFYLPMHHTDFIFSIIAEEVGFMGASCLITLYILFLFFGFRIAVQLTDPFSKLATFGFITLISLQAALNLLVACGLVPTKGLGLPFISYGNTGLISCLAMLGFIINMVYEHKKTRNYSHG